MAYYKYRQFLKREKGIEFDDLHAPGTTAPLSGVYACDACQASIVAIHSQPLPAADHHVHAEGEPIWWRLVVRSQFK